MTHSLEVGQIGRYLARTAIKELRLLDENYLDPELDQAFINLVETSCLIHDIGNPPFGHFGESAIQNWFSSNGKDCATSAYSQINLDLFNKSLLPDFVQFDGNSQGFRLLTKLLWTRDEFGLNLTYSQLASYLKYVRSTDEEKTGNFTKKPGFFLTEKNIVEDVWESLEMAKNDRFPLTYLMEAADDIAYCISDIEDGIEKNIITENLFREKILVEWRFWCNELNITDENWLIELLDTAWNRSREGVEQSRFLYFKTNFTTTLVNFAASQYARDHDNLLNRKANPLLENKTKEHAALKALKSFSRRYLYRSISVEGIELAGHQVITGILDHYRRLLSCQKTDFVKICGLDEQSNNFDFEIIHEVPVGLDFEVRLFNKLPRKYRRCYYNSVKKKGGADNISGEDEWLIRSHLVIDYIAGMTDHYALETFQLLSGIKVD